MYKVLIVDDELLVRIGLKTTIDWEGIGFSVVAEASNGELGLEQYRKYLPDVVFTDIRMPKKDGLWLIEEIRKESQEVEILVLTCLDEFSYARKALKIGANDYILKSEVEDEELIGGMLALKSKLDARQSFGREQHGVRSGIQESGKILPEALIREGFSVKPENMQALENLGFGEPGMQYGFFSIHFEPLLTGDMQSQGSNQINSAILNIICDRLSENGMAHGYFQQPDSVLFFIGLPQLTSAQIRGTLSAIITASKQYFDSAVRMAYCEPFLALKDAQGVYADFTRREQGLFYTQGDQPLRAASDFEISEINVFELGKRYNPVFVECIGQENIRQTEELIGQIADFRTESQINLLTAKVFYSNMVGELFSHYGSIITEHPKIKNYETYHYQILSAVHISHISSLLQAFAQLAIEEIRQSRYRNAKWIISRALHFIENHYDSKISLDDVAMELNLSKHYLCNVFKKETGENMSLTINRLRIEKAKQLLLNRNCRIKEVYELVGFSNQQYFSKVFKKVAGMTVSEFRESKLS